MEIFPKRYQNKNVVAAFLIAMLLSLPSYTMESSAQNQCPAGYHNVPSASLKISNGLLADKLEEILKAQKDNIASAISNLEIEDWFLFRKNMSSCKESLDTKAAKLDEKDDCLYLPSFLSASKNPDMSFDVMSDRKRASNLYFRFKDMALSDVSLENIKVDCDVKKGENICMAEAEVPSFAIQSNYELRHADHSRYFGSNNPDRIEVKSKARPNKIKFQVRLHSRSSGKNLIEVIDHSLRLEVPNENVDLKENGKAHKYTSSQILEDLAYRHNQGVEDSNYPSEGKGEDLLKKQINYILNKYYQNDKEKMRQDISSLSKGMHTQSALIKTLEPTNSASNLSLKNYTDEIINSLEPALDKIIGGAIENFSPRGPVISNPTEVQLPVLTANDFLNYGKQQEQHQKLREALLDDQDYIIGLNKKREVENLALKLQSNLDDVLDFSESAKKSTNPDLLALLSDLKPIVGDLKTEILQKAESLEMAKRNRDGKLIFDRKYEEFYLAYEKAYELEKILNQRITMLEENTQANSKKIILNIHSSQHNSPDHHDILFNMCSPGFPSRNRTNPFIGDVHNKTCIKDYDFLIEIDIKAINDYLTTLHDDGVFRLCTTKSDRICEQVNIGSRQSVNLKKAPQIKVDDMGNYYLDIPEIEREGTFLGVKPILGKVMNSDVSSCRVYLNHHISDPTSLIQKENVECEANFLKTLSWEHFLVLASPASSAIAAMAGKTLLHSAIQEQILDSDKIRSRFADVLNGQLGDAIVGTKTREMVVANGKLTLAGNIQKKGQEEHRLSSEEIRCFHANDNNKSARALN